MLIFSKMLIFLKNTDLCERSSFLAKIGRQQKSLQKLGKKFFTESNFRERLWGILRKSDWIFAKIAKFAEFLLYTAKIVFFDHTPRNWLFH
jgi:hypothetical protein